MSEPIDTSTAAFIEKARVMALPSHNALRADLSGGTVSRDYVDETLEDAIRVLVTSWRDDGEGGEWWIEEQPESDAVRALADRLMPLLARERVAGAAEQREKDAVLADGVANDLSDVALATALLKHGVATGVRLATQADGARKVAAAIRGGNTK